MTARNLSLFTAANSLMGLVGQLAKSVKVIKTGALTKAVALKGVGATAGAFVVVKLNVPSARNCVASPIFCASV